MKITGSNLSSTSIRTQKAVGDTAAQPNAAAHLTGASPAASYTPSAELTRLLQLARATPDVREERLSDVLEKLRDGRYDTPEIMSKTAEAILAISKE